MNTKKRIKALEARVTDAEDMLLQHQDDLFFRFLDSLEFKALEQRVAALEGTAGAKVVEQDYRESVTAPETDTTEGVTLGKWRRFANAMWIRDSGDVEHFGSVWSFRSEWCSSFGPHGEYDSVGLGTFATLSAAMLATDERLRAAGVALPETVEIVNGGSELLLCGAEAVSWRPSSGLVYEHDGQHESEAGWVGVEDLGHDSREAMHEVLSYMAETLGWDTAIARAQLRERQTIVSDGETITMRNTGGGFRDDEPDPIATRKAAADGWGWDVHERAETRSSVWLANHKELRAAGWHDSLPDLLDAIEAREMEAAEGRGWCVMASNNVTPRWVAARENWSSVSADTRHELLTTIHEAEAREAEQAEDRRIVHATADGDMETICGIFPAPESDAEWSQHEHDQATCEGCRAAIAEQAKPARPLDGVVLSGEWLGGEEWDTMADVDGNVVVQMTTMGADREVFWLVEGKRTGAYRPLFTAIGTRADAIAKAVELGAEVAS